MNLPSFSKQISSTLFALSLALVFLSCHETPPFIDYSKPILLTRDTSYLTSPIPAAQPKNVLIEDISGVRCINCPQAADAAHAIVDANAPGRIVVLTLHSFSFVGFTRPISDTFNTDEATLIIKNLIGDPQGLPIGAVDRKIYAGKTDPLLSYPTWNTYVEQQLTTIPAANIELELIPDKVGRKVIANVKVTLLENNSDAVYLSVFVSQSHIFSHQQTVGGLVDNFEHNFILRKAITPFSGTKLIDNSVAGMVYEKGFEIDILDKWVFDDCNIVVIVNKVKSGDNQALQAVSKGLKR